MPFRFGKKIFGSDNIVWGARKWVPHFRLPQSATPAPAASRPLPHNQQASPNKPAKTTPRSAQDSDDSTRKPSMKTGRLWQKCT